MTDISKEAVERIEDQVRQMRLPILCLDFDGVLHSYSSGWKGADVITDAPTFGAMKFLAEAVNHFRVAVYSSRSGQHGGIDAMRVWLRLWLTNDLEGDQAEHVYSLIEWPTEKPPAFVGIDDRVLTFGGTWPSMEAMKAFKPWNKGGETQLIFRGEFEQIRNERDALQARVEELEYEQSADFDMGRVQGLEEAKAKVEELWACRTCREVADAIEALKEQTND